MMPVCARQRRSPFPDLDPTTRFEVACTHAFAHTASTGEFRVDFDDEAEGEAWISASQQWRSLGPDFEAGGDEHKSSAPALTHLAPSPAEEVVAAAPAAAVTLTAGESASFACGPPQADDEMGQLVAAEFSELLHTTMLADGLGAEPLHGTRLRFQRLYEETAAGDDARASGDG